MRRLTMTIAVVAVLGLAGQSARPADETCDSTSCCQQCGRHCDCLQKTCQLGCEMKKETKSCWCVETQEFCPLMPACHHGCCDDDCCLPRCGNSKCVKKLVKKEYQVETPVYKCVVRYLCPECCNGGSTGVSPSAAPRRRRQPLQCPRHRPFPLLRRECRGRSHPRKRRNCRGGRAGRGRRFPLGQGHHNAFHDNPCDHCEPVRCRRIRHLGPGRRAGNGHVHNCGFHDVGPVARIRSTTAGGGTGCPATAGSTGAITSGTTTIRRHSLPTTPSRFRPIEPNRHPAARRPRIRTSTRSMGGRSPLWIVVRWK